LNDDDFVTNYAIVNELRRLGEQIELQHLARMKVLIQSASNLLKILSLLATPAHMKIVRHNLLKECDVFRLPKLSASTAVLWSDIVIKQVRHGKKMPGGGGWRYARVFATCKTRSQEDSLLRAIHFTDSFPFGMWVET
jgi:hypothetical protein